MSWVEELGEKEFTEKEVKTMAKMLVLVGSLAEGEEGEFEEAMTEVIDTSITNLTNIKKAIKEE